MNFIWAGSTNRPQVREFWGRRFQWTSRHPSSEILHALKFTYDELADECLEKLNSIQLQADHGETVGRDLFVLLQQHAANDHKLQTLWDQVTSVPDWVDWGQIERGQEVFYRYGMANLSAVGDPILDQHLLQFH